MTLPLIPQAGDYLAVSQVDLLSNTTSLNTRLALTAGGLVATGATNGLLHTINNGGRIELYYRRESDNINLPISKISSYGLINGVSGLLEAGDNFNILSASGGVGVYNVTFSVRNYIDDWYTVLATPRSALPAFVSIDNTAGNGFTIRVFDLAGAPTNPAHVSVMVMGRLS